MQLVALFDPMDQVRADGVPPGHVAPLPAKGIVLVEQVILAIVVQQPMWIVIPAALGREMELGTKFFLIELGFTGKGVVTVDRLETLQLALRQCPGPYESRLSNEILNFKVEPVVRLTRSQTDGEFAYFLVINLKAYKDLVRSLFDRDIQVLPCNLDSPISGKSTDAADG
jgi:hypothetical protein